MDAAALMIKDDLQTFENFFFKISKLYTNRLYTNHLERLGDD